MSTSRRINTDVLQHAIEQVPNNPTIINEEENYLDESFDREYALEKLKTIREFNKTLEQNNGERKKYAKHIFSLTCFWAILIFVILFFQGFKLTHLSDTVLVTLITSTTLNFFGFFLLVTKYLFNTESRKQDPLQRELREAIG